MSAAARDVANRNMQVRNNISSNKKEVCIPFDLLTGSRKLSISIQIKACQICVS